MVKRFEELYKLAEQQRADLVVRTYDFRVKNPMSVPKTFLDRAERTTQKDYAVIRNPQKMATLYADTTAVVADNLKIWSTRDKTSASVKAKLEPAKAKFLSELEQRKQNNFSILNSGQNVTSDAFSCPSLKVHDGGRSFDLLSKQYPPGVRCNFFVQEQLGSNFLYAYSDQLIANRSANSTANSEVEKSSKRIYMNPDFEATPKIFGETLRALNDAGIPAELKMLHRVQELQDERASDTRGRNISCRGDGIVLYVDGIYADQALKVVLDVAQENAVAFQDRDVSKVPLRIAPGIAIADEFGIKGHSTTSAVAEVLNCDATQGLEHYRREVEAKANKMGINPKQLYKGLDTEKTTSRIRGLNDQPGTPKLGTKMGVGTNPKVSGFHQPSPGLTRQFGQGRSR